MTAFDRDDLIKLALTPADTVRAPADLGDEIERGIATTPQRRSLIPWFAVARWIPAPSPAMVLAALVALLLLVGVLLALANRQPPSPGLTVYHGGPARTGVLPGPGPVGVPVVVWQHDLKGSVPVTAMPVVVDRVVYVADGGGFVWAFDAASGTPLGTPAEIGSAVLSSPTVAMGTLIVGADDGSLTALELGGLRRRWHVDVSPGEPIQASLVAVDDVLYVPSGDGNLYEIDPADGKQVGTIAIGRPLTRGPAIAGGTIYLGTSDGLVVAIDQATASTKWKRDLGPDGIGTPAVVGDTVYVPRGIQGASGPHEVVALPISGADSSWTFPSPADAEIFVGAVGEDMVFAVAKDGFVYGLDRATGTERWRHDTGAPIGALAGLVDGVLYVTNDGHEVIALDAATGNERWSVSVDGAPSMAAVIGGRVFVATSLGKMIALGDVP
jgi:outer membrane protein assembly factor BamB